MAWTMPAPPPGLADLLKRGGQLPPNPFGATSPQQSAPIAPSGQDAMRAAIIPQQAPPPQAAPAPPPSDDPAISPVPQAPDISNSPVVGLQKQMADTSTQIAAVPRPDPTKLRPKLWERLAGAGTAFAAGWKDPALGYEIGSNVTNRRFNQAQSDYKHQVSPLQEQLEAERAQLPAAEAAARIPQNAWENRMKQHEEERQTSTGEGRVEHMRAQNDLANQRAENLDYQLKHPKQSEPKNADEALSAASAAKDPEEKKRLIQLAGDLHRQEIDRIKSAREPKTDNTRGKPGQFATVGTHKAQALQKAEQNYRKSLSLLTPNDTKGQQEALEQLNQDKQAAQDAYEEGITTLGGSAEHVDVTQPQTPAATAPPAAAPAAATPAKTNSPGEKTLSLELAKEYVQKAGGDKEKARAAARKDGYKF